MEILWFALSTFHSLKLNSTFVACTLAVRVSGLLALPALEVTVTLAVDVLNSEKSDLRCFLFTTVVLALYIQISVSVYRVYDNCVKQYSKEDSKGGGHLTKMGLLS